MLSQLIDLEVIELETTTRDRKIVDEIVCYLFYFLASFVTGASYLLGIKMVG